MSWGSMAKEGDSTLLVPVLPESELSFESVRKSQGTLVMGGGTNGSGLGKSSSKEKLNQSEVFGSEMIGRGEKRGEDMEGEGSRESEVVET
jgi:hypothetical protein